jgi:hypothetical protein
VVEGDIKKPVMAEKVRRRSDQTTGRGARTRGVCTGLLGNHIERQQGQESDNGKSTQYAAHIFPRSDQVDA